MEDLCFVTIWDWMLYPNQRVCGYRVKVMKILCSQRPEFEEPAFQNRLEVNGHSMLFSRWTVLYPPL